MGQLPGFELVVDPPVLLNFHGHLGDVVQGEGVDHEPDHGADLDSCGLGGFRLLGGSGFDLGHEEILQSDEFARLYPRGFVRGRRKLTDARASGRLDSSYN